MVQSPLTCKVIFRIIGNVTFNRVGMMVSGPGAI